MITLEVEPYCEDCRYFEPAHTTNTFYHENTIIRVETVVECVNREKCRNIAKQYATKVKEDE